MYERRGGREAVTRAERTVIEAIDVVGAVVEDEGIDCGWVKGGSLRVATSAPQLARIEESIRARRARGFGEEDVRQLTLDELRERVRVADVRGASFTPHCARVDPARLVRGLAEACERRGVAIYERTRALRIEPGRVVSERGTVRAQTVVRATESYTTRLPGERRRFLPVFSHMIATEPLPEAVWAQLGWAGMETIADQHHTFFYAQRTPDGRIAVGGCGAPYRYGNVIREEDERRPAIRARLEAALRRHFPPAAEARITHEWGGPFAAPRDWSMAVHHDRATGMAWAGGYTGHGVTGSSVAGRTLADLILGRETELTSLPWVGHRSRRWEPEPLRYLGSRAIVAVVESADRAEDRTDRPARRLRLVERWLPGR